MASVLANIGLIGLILLCFPTRVWRYEYLCPLITFYRVFVVILNRCGSIKTEKIVLTLNWRIIPISILAYRYLMVCHVNLCYRSVSQSSCFLLERLTWWYPELERRLSEIFLSGEADDVKRISISGYFILFTDWRFWSHLYLLVRQYITETRSGKF